MAFPESCAKDVAHYLVDDRLIKLLFQYPPYKFIPNRKEKLNNMLIDFGIIFEIKEKLFLVRNRAYVDPVYICIYTYVCLGLHFSIRDPSLVLLH